MSKSDHPATGLHHSTTTTDDQSGGITVGVPMFSRETALRNFLESVPAYVDEVLVADNGETVDRRLYARAYATDVRVLDLPYDCGIGACRAALVEACDSEYLWLGDSDMEFSSASDLQTLRSILNANPGLGGVSGWLREGETIRSGAKDLVQHGDTLLKTIPESPTVSQNPVPHARFDFIPQCGLFRMACFEDYSYDPDIYNSEHLDFFYGHLQTDWAFASTPAVLIQHHKHIDEEYRQRKRGENRVDFDVMQSKWGFSEVHPGRRADWCTTRQRSTGERVFDLVRRVTPPRVWIPLRKVAAKGGIA